jgi:hypothetical protein
MPLICAFLLASCATQSKPSSPKNIGPETIKFESTPSGGKVTMRDPQDLTYVMSCTTPCELSLEVDRALDFEAIKTGFLSKSSKNIFKRDLSSEKLSMAMIQAMTGKTFSYGQRTIKVEFLTAEQEAKREIEKANKLEAKRQEDKKIQTAMEDNSLAQCNTVNQSGQQSTDKTAQPLVRIPPIMPSNAESSGHCRMKINVNESGRVSDAMATYCTNDIFRAASLKSVQKWIFTPKLVNGEPMSRCGVETKISYKMMDSSGKLLPE